MQTLDVISVNVWLMLISLLNLLILFLLLKKFLYKPVQNMLAKRQEAVDKEYAEAAEANEKAQQDQANWQERMEHAQEQADRILHDAAATAQEHSDRMIAAAKEKAAGVMRQAEAEAVLERQKAEDDMKREIVDVSAKLAEKMLGRELRHEDHQAIIDTFLDEIGESYDTTK